MLKFIEEFGQKRYNLEIINGNLSLALRCICFMSYHPAIQSIKEEMK